MSESSTNVLPVDRDLRVRVTYLRLGPRWFVERFYADPGYWGAVSFGFDTEAEAVTELVVMRLRE